MRVARFFSNKPRDTDEGVSQSKLEQLALAPAGE